MSSKRRRKSSASAAAIQAALDIALEQAQWLEQQKYQQQQETPIEANRAASLPYGVGMVQQ